MGPEERGREGQNLQGHLCRAESKVSDSSDAGARPLRDNVSDLPPLPGSKVFHHRFNKVDLGPESPGLGPGLCERRVRVRGF